MKKVIIAVVLFVSAPIFAQKIATVDIDGFRDVKFFSEINEGGQFEPIMDSDGTPSNYDYVRASDNLIYEDKELTAIKYSTLGIDKKIRSISLVFESDSKADVNEWYACFVSLYSSKYGKVKPVKSKKTTDTQNGTFTLLREESDWDLKLCSVVISRATSKYKFKNNQGEASESHSASIAFYAKKQ